VKQLKLYNINSLLLISIIDSYYLTLVILLIMCIKNKKNQNTAKFLISFIVSTI